MCCVLLRSVSNTGTISSYLCQTEGTLQSLTMTVSSVLSCHTDVPAMTYITMQDHVIPSMISPIGGVFKLDS